jgi:hypothetical protein
LSGLLVNDCDPGKRFGLSEIAVGDKHYWQFDA